MAVSYLPFHALAALHCCSFGNTHFLSCNGYTDWGLGLQTKTYCFKRGGEGGESTTVSTNWGNVNRLTQKYKMDGAKKRFRVLQEVALLLEEKLDRKERVVKRLKVENRSRPPWTLLTRQSHPRLPPDFGGLLERSALSRELLRSGLRVIFCIR